jgi:hypothetical protein
MNDTQNENLEEALKEAQKYGATTDEVKEIFAIVREANTHPEMVKSVVLNFGPDSTDQRSVFVHLIIDDDLKPSEEKIDTLANLATQVQTALLHAQLSFWPYVDYQDRTG